MTAWTETAKARVSAIRREWWAKHQAERDRRAEMLRLRWKQQRAEGQPGRLGPCAAVEKPPNLNGLDEQCRRRGVVIVEKTIHKMDLWPKPWRELEKVEWNSQNTQKTIFNH